MPEAISELERRVIDSVAHTGTPFEIIEINPEFSDTTAFCEKYAYRPEETCNTILVTSKRGPAKTAACVILSNTRLDVNKRVRNLLGAQKASFTSPAEVLDLTGMEIGGVTPFALPPDLQFFVDERVMIPEWIILGGGSRRLKIKTKPQALTELGAEVITGLALQL